MQHKRPRKLAAVQRMLPDKWLRAEDDSGEPHSLLHGSHITVLATRAVHVPLINRIDAVCFPSHRLLTAGENRRRHRAD